MEKNSCEFVCVLANRPSHLRSKVSRKVDCIAEAHLLCQYSENTMKKILLEYLQFMITFIGSTLDMLCSRVKQITVV